MVEQAEDRVRGISERGEVLRGPVAGEPIVERPPAPVTRTRAGVPGEAGALLHVRVVAVLRDLGDRSLEAFHETLDHLVRDLQAPQVLGGLLRTV
jgi:hypothetical protein